MTSARMVTLGQAMAMIPTMTARMPSRIKEVDVDLNMKGIPFACLKRTTSSGKSEAPVMSRRRDGRRCWPTSAAYGAIGAGWGQAGPAGVAFAGLAAYAGDSTLGAPQLPTPHQCMQHYRSHPHDEQ